MDTLKVSSHRREEFIDISQEVAALARARGYRDGVLHLFVPHTTAGITLNEGFDPSVRADAIAALARLVPHRDEAYRHDEGNSDAHIKSVLVGTSVAVPIERGLPALGRWQAIFFCEFDGPRTREVRACFTACPGSGS